MLRLLNQLSRRVGQRSLPSSRCTLLKISKQQHSFSHARPRLTYSYGCKIIGAQQVYQNYLVSYRRCFSAQQRASKSKFRCERPSVDHHPDSGSNFKHKYKQMEQKLNNLNTGEHALRFEAFESQPRFFQQVSSFEVWPQRHQKEETTTGTRVNEKNGAVSGNDFNDPDSDQCRSSGTTVKKRALHQDDMQQISHHDFGGRPPLRYAIYKLYSELSHEERDRANDKNDETVQLISPQHSHNNQNEHARADPKCHVLLTQSYSVVNSINKIMPPILELLESNSILINGLTKVRFHATISANQIMVSLLYDQSKFIEECWLQEAESLLGNFDGQIKSITGRSQEQYVSAGPTALVEEYNLPSKQLPSSMPWLKSLQSKIVLPSQTIAVSRPDDYLENPNKKVYEDMLDWVRMALARLECGHEIPSDTSIEAAAAYFADTDAASYFDNKISFRQRSCQINTERNSEDINSNEQLLGDLLELQCGIGTLTCTLAPLFNHVFAVGSGSHFTDQAKENLNMNNIKNVTLALNQPGDVAQAIQNTLAPDPWAHHGVVNYSYAEPNFSNDCKQHIKLIDEPKMSDKNGGPSHSDSIDFSFSTLLMDSSHSGLDPSTRRLASYFPKILYISSNMETLVADLHDLRATHVLREAAFFDQLPFTKHNVCAVLLQRDIPNLS